MFVMVIVILLLDPDLKTLMVTKAAPGRDTKCFLFKNLLKIENVGKMSQQQQQQQQQQL